MSILKWIDVGKVSAERDDNLTHYFFDNGVLRSVIDNPSAFLVLGRKGAGKTAVFRHLTSNPEQFLDQDDLLVSLSFEDYNWKIHTLLATAEAAESLAYKQSWRFVILVEAVKKCCEWLTQEGRTVPKPLQRANQLLQKVFDSPVPSIYQIVGRKLLSLSKMRLPKAGLDFENGDFDSVEMNAGEVAFEQVAQSDDLREHLSKNIENLISILELGVSSISTLGCRVFLCFDRVDEAWDDISVESSRKVIAGLVGASDSLTTQYRGVIRPVVFLREDIFEVLSLNDANKLREDCGALLKWERDSLYKLLLSRINFYARKNGGEAISDIDSLFDKPEMRQRAKPSSYILKRSMMRPRDMICLFKRVIETMQERANDPFEDTTVQPTLLSVDAIYDAEPGYSDWLKKEIIDEWGVQSPEIKELLDALQNNGSTIISKDNLIAEFQKLDKVLRASDATQYLRFLFDNSVIGFKLGASTLWKYKCFYPSQGFVDSEEYRVHDGLVRALNLKEPRGE